MTEEIKICDVHIETPIIVSENFVQLLILESPDEFYNCIRDLMHIMDGNEGRWVFTRGGNEIAADKLGSIIPNVFALSLNDKKILSLLYKKLTESSLNSENLLDFNELNAVNFRFIEKITFGLPFTFKYSEPSPSDYFKAIGLNFEDNYLSLLEKILCYINILIELKGCEFFIFVNLKSVLSDDNLRELYKHCQLEKVGLLLIESTKVRSLLNNERAIIITEDLCEIVENY